MDNKRHMSIDDTGAPPSPLRRHRFTLRRTSTGSSSSSSSSVSSLDGQEQSGCVSRETSRDECALHRLVVWAAVKRNSSPKMTPEEKRECPMLRCRKRFPGHELMLQHLYACDHLDSGEYWCYDCGRVERFNDATCRRCLGHHHSRRRKIMVMAKSFFGSLGHKSRAGGLQGLDHGDVEDIPPPKYQAVVTPDEAELVCNEIHEIDSSEVPLITIHESSMEAEEQEPVPETLPEPIPAAMPETAPTFGAVLPASQPPPFFPVELDSRPEIEEPLINWDPQFPPSTVAPASLLFNRHQTQDMERPVLQLHTSGLSQYRPRVKRRSKELAPSSSVRSTASTDSTASTNSMDSTASCDISPFSAWSGAWRKAPGFDSTLTSPADDLMSPGGLFHTNSVSASSKPPPANKILDLGNHEPDSFLSELPADMPMLDAFSSSHNLHDALDLCRPSFSFDAPSPKELSIESNLALTDDDSMQHGLSQLVLQPITAPLGNAHALIGSAWETLQMHVADSLAKLRNIPNNHLVTQLGEMSTSEVATSGLATLTDVLDGQQIQSPVRLLCVIHVVYSFALVVHEQDAGPRSTALFAQAVAYGSRFSRRDRQAYIHVVDTLWKPNGLNDSEVAGLLRAKMGSQVSEAGGRGGKQPESSTPSVSEDELISVAQYFLDELEYAALQAVDQPDLQASELSVQHLKDVNLDAHKDPSFAMDSNGVIRSLLQQYASFPNLVAAIGGLLNRVNSNYVSTPRRLELELLHIGRLYLMPSTFFDTYIPTVRLHMNSLYAQDEAHDNQRVTYHKFGLKLIESTIQSFAPINTSAESSTIMPPAVSSIDDFISSITPSMVNFDFGSIPHFNADASTSFNMSFPELSVGHGEELLSTAEGSASTSEPPATAAASPSAASGSATTKVESNSCCTLCGYRPKGDPRWFGGSMAKHMKLQHAPTPDKIYRCPYPGCTSQFRKRPDNLRQHQIEKGHFVEGQEESSSRRPSKRKKTEGES